MVLSDLAKGGLENVVCIDDNNNQNIDKNNMITNSTSLLFFPCSVP